MVSLIKVKNLLIIKLIFLLFLVYSCKSINKKSEEIVKKENKKLSKFIGQPVSELKILMGNPDYESKSETGLKLLVYTTKKYGISCERKFEINQLDMIIGFASKGCF